jgi:plasmid replication initiation protein
MEEKTSQNIIILKQHKKVTEAWYEMSALRKSILYMVMAQFKDDDPVGKKYFVSIQEIKNKLKEVGQQVDLTQIQEDIRKLISQVYIFNDDQGDHVQMSLFSVVEYTDESDVIKIGIVPEVRRYLFDLEFDFTSYQFLAALSLESIYSKRIYEMISHYKDVGIFKISVQELRDRLKLTINSNKLNGWTAFEKTVLESPVKEVNEKTELNATYSLKKTGPKYTDIEFYITKKEDTVPKEGVQAQLKLGI